MQANVSDHRLIGAGIVDKLPLVVMILLFIGEDGLLRAGRLEADDPCAAEGLAGLAKGGCAV